MFHLESPVINGPKSLLRQCYQDGGLGINTPCNIFHSYELSTPRRSLVSPRLPLCLLCLHFSKVRGQVPSLLPVLLIGGPLVLGEHGLQHRAVQGALDAESPGVKQVLWQPGERLLHLSLRWNLQMRSWRTCFCPYP